MSESMEITEQESDLRAKLHALQVEHRDLDQIIAQLQAVPPPDELMLRRMKKRKLLLKDRISVLERMLEPDEPA
ncbi:MAG TPA: YdcH family protein [Rhodocyclaceae bacterium]|nr:YdcH family protein [Rhodocyclaceae bacterium]HMV55250.1 YdcH family protein [Rhodocyclaceae bacterium]HMZ84988.1 YdcH family protein [Rhodocyclaceae bacterium]HNA05092.1 YdcH family protein [Rhodocyclaceae bacterium]HNB77798.1 YdcH family protein [Rhodocyclaceae bacterium]